MNKNILEVKNLVVGFNRQSDALKVNAPIVSGVDLCLPRAKTLGLVGESGCGKSLLVTSLLGLVPKGFDFRFDSYSFDGAKITKQGIKNLRGKDIGFIFQDPMTALNPVLTIGRQLTEHLREHTGCDFKDAHRQACELLDELKVNEAQNRMKQYPTELSGGMRQRVMIAIALICKPKVVIADEPTTALDVTVQADILDLLKELQISRQLSMIFISHDLGVVNDFADQVHVMYSGKIIERVHTSNIIEHSRHPYTSDLLNCTPGSHLLGQRLNTIPGIVEAVEDRPSGCLYVNRCKKATEVCRQEFPKLTSTKETDFWCHHG